MPKSLPVIEFFLLLDLLEKINKYIKILVRNIRLKYTICRILNPKLYFRYCIRLDFKLGIY